MIEKKKAGNGEEGHLTLTIITYRTKDNRQATIINIDNRHRQ
jgi:hypothetical protein